ncbi:hypothetical protein HG530_010647 [Fusarium avenaceum]|nr:hypothetical protein HG530_010647 [Fusarium avenaceum]
MTFKNVLVIGKARLFLRSSKRPILGDAGANRGIGLNLLKAFLAQSWNATASIRLQSRDDPSIADLKETGAKVLEIDYLVEETIENAAKAYGDKPLDILINSLTYFFTSSSSSKAMERAVQRPNGGKIPCDGCGTISGDQTLLVKSGESHRAQGHKYLVILWFHFKPNSFALPRAWHRDLRLSVGWNPNPQMEPNIRHSPVRRDSSISTYKLCTCKHTVKVVCCVDALESETKRRCPRKACPHEVVVVLNNLAQCRRGFISLLFLEQIEAERKGISSLCPIRKLSARGPSTLELALEVCALKLVLLGYIRFPKGPNYL